MNNNASNHQDPQPTRGNDSNGHLNNGNKYGHDNGNRGGHGRPSRPSKPGNSHAVVGVWNNQLSNI